MKAALLATPVVSAAYLLATLRPSNSKCSAELTSLRANLRILVVSLYELQYA